MSPTTAIIVGAGQRALIYASYAHYHPDELKIVGVAEPVARRRAQVAELYELPPARCFATAQEVAQVPRFADVVINGTMDHQHVETAIPLLDVGYDMLLEKPFATSEAEMWRLVAAAERNDSNVMICHVLRYASFYAAIRHRILDGAIGDLLSMQTSEHVSYHHMAVSYVRGKWARKQHGYASMLMGKCSHDLDLIAWLKSGVHPRSVSSFGSNFQFRPERAPAGAGTRCLVDCAIEPDCPYSARKHYLASTDRRNAYVWQDSDNVDGGLTMEKKIALLKGSSPFGRCVWKCDMDVVDHQTVLIEFDDGATATHTMVGGATKASRDIHLVGTLGEIEGTFEDDRFVIRYIHPRLDLAYAEEVVDLSHRGGRYGDLSRHGGGDLRLVADFLRVIRGERPSISTTRLEDSVAGHLIGFSADRSMETGSVVRLDDRY
jgi:predicted dehydrogenase